MAEKHPMFHKNLETLKRRFEELYPDHAWQDGTDQSPKQAALDWLDSGLLESVRLTEMEIQSFFEDLYL